jgi:hypothetical protein
VNAVETKMSVGFTVKKKFVAALICGLIVLGAMVGVFGMTGTALALPLGGMGDFYVQFDKLEGKGFEMLPQIGETGNSDASPMVRNKIEEATVYNLLIYKDLKLPDGKWIRVNIKGTQPTEIHGLIQDARYIEANLQFSNLGIHEKNTDDYTKNWSQSAEKVTITNAKIVTDYLFQTRVKLQGAKISIESIDKPETIN